MIEPHYLGFTECSCVGGQGEVQVRIRNETSNCLPAQTLEVVATDYWQTSTADVSAVKPYRVASVRIYLRAREGKQLSDVPNRVTFRLTKSDCLHPTRLSFSFFRKSLAQWSPQHLPGAQGSKKFNLLLLGPPSSTKSSFINSVLTLDSGPSKLCAGLLEMLEIPNSAATISNDYQLFFKCC